MGTFYDSNIGVIKCYNLVFNIKDKYKNIGFWIFTFLVFFHIPIIIYFFLYKLISIQKYISFQINKFGYWTHISNPIKNRKSILKKDKNKIFDGKEVTKNGKEQVILFKKSIKRDELKKKIGNFTSSKIHNLSNNFSINSFKLYKSS